VVIVCTVEGDHTPGQAGTRLTSGAPGKAQGRPSRPEQSCGSLFTHGGPQCAQGDLTKLLRFFPSTVEAGPPLAAKTHRGTCNVWCRSSWPSSGQPGA